MAQKRIGLTMRVESAPLYEEWRDCLAQDWFVFFAHAFPDWLAVPVPNLSPTAVCGYVESLALDGLILTGGNDLGDHPGREAAEIALLEHYSTLRKPVLGICRGMQLIHHHFGGTLSAVSPERHARQTHPVTIVHTALSLERGTALSVNSYHRYGIAANSLPACFIPVALAEDGTVEAFFHQELNIAGLMWHPERNAPFDANSITLMKGWFER